jgi:hypothetical protein
MTHPRLHASEELQPAHAAASLVTDYGRKATGETGETHRAPPPRAIGSAAFCAPARGIKMDSDVQRNSLRSFHKKAGKERNKFRSTVFLQTLYF